MNMMNCQPTKKWNESGFRPPLCTYRLNWARRTSWGWWDDTVLQTQDSKFGPWRSEAEHATSRSRRLPTILTFTREWGRNIFKPPRPGTEPRALAWKAAVLTTTLGPPPLPKWNESGFRPPLCTYRINWARRTSWGWWDDWDDTVLQTQDSKFEPWRSEAEHATSRSRRLPTILTFTRGWGRNIFCFFQTADTGNRTPDSGVKGSGANHYPRAPAPAPANRQKTQTPCWSMPGHDRLTWTSINSNSTGSSSRVVGVAFRIEFSSRTSKQETPIHW